MSDLEYRILGRTGIKVSEIGFGCGNVGGLRLRGEMNFVTDDDTRAEIHGCAGFIQGFWETPKDPDFVLMEFTPHKFELMRPGSIEIVRGDF